MTGKADVRFLLARLFQDGGVYLARVPEAGLRGQGEPREKGDCQGGGRVRVCRY